MTKYGVSVGSSQSVPSRSSYLNTRLIPCSLPIFFPHVDIYKRLNCTKLGVRMLKSLNLSRNAASFFVINVNLQTLLTN